MLGTWVTAWAWLGYKWMHGYVGYVLGKVGYIHGYVGYLGMFGTWVCLVLGYET